MGGHCNIKQSPPSLVLRGLPTVLESVSVGEEAGQGRVVDLGEGGVGGREHGEGRGQSGLLAERRPERREQRGEARVRGEQLARGREVAGAWGQGRDIVPISRTLGVREIYLKSIFYRPNNFAVCIFNSKYFLQCLKVKCDQVLRGLDSSKRSLETCSASTASRGDCAPTGH